MTQETLREAVAVRFDFDGYGYQYMDSGSGSDWLTRKPDAEPLFTADEIDRRVAEEKAKLFERLRTPSDGMFEAAVRTEGVILDDSDGVEIFPKRIWQAMLAAFQQENSDAI